MSRRPQRQYLTLEQLCRFREGYEYSVTWRYRDDTEMNHLKRAARKGYFYRKRTAPGSTTFVRTAKKFIEGDSTKKPLHFSWPDPNEVPASLRPIIEASRSNVQPA